MKVIFQIYLKILKIFKVSKEILVLLNIINSFLKNLSLLNRKDYFFTQILSIIQVNKLEIRVSFSSTLVMLFDLPP